MMLLHMLPRKPAAACCRPLLTDWAVVQCSGVLHPIAASGADVSGVRQQGHGASQAQAVGGGGGGLYTGKGWRAHCGGVVQGKGWGLQGVLVIPYCEGVHRHASDCKEREGETGVGD